MNPEPRQINPDDVLMLWKRGYIWNNDPGNDFIFFRNGITYDFSAADLSQIEIIETKGLFMVKL